MSNQNLDKSSIYWFKLESQNELLSKIDKIREKIWVPDTSHMLLFAIDILGKYVDQKAIETLEKTFKEKLADITPEVRIKMPKEYGGGVLIGLKSSGYVVMSAEIVSIGTALSPAWKARKFQVSIQPQDTIYHFVWASNAGFLKISSDTNADLELKRILNPFRDNNECQIQ